MVFGVHATIDAANNADHAHLTGSWQLVPRNALPIIILMGSNCGLLMEKLMSAQRSRYFPFAKRMSVPDR